MAAVVVAVVLNDVYASPFVKQSSSVACICWSVVREISSSSFTSFPGEEEEGAVLSTKVQCDTVIEQVLGHITVIGHH